MDGNSALSSSGDEPSSANIASPRDPLLGTGCVRLLGRGGRFPLARRMESRTVARPKEGERWRFIVGAASRGTLGGLGRAGIGGI